MKLTNILVFILAAVLLLSAPTTLFAQHPIDALYEFYNPDGALTFDAKRGEQLWNQENIDKTGKVRDCTSCHGEDLKENGKHKKTGKVIEPMAYSVNNKRYKKLKKVKKWFKRNCKWTFGRECTTQEKGDILKFLYQY